MSHQTHSFCVFQDSQGGDTVEKTADLLAEYGPTARIILHTDSEHLVQVIRHAQETGVGFYIQVKAAHGDGGDPNNNSHPCPPSPGC